MAELVKCSFIIQFLQPQPVANHYGLQACCYTVWAQFLFAGTANPTVSLDRQVGNDIPPCDVVLLKVELIGQENSR